MGTVCKYSHKHYGKRIYSHENRYIHRTDAKAVKDYGCDACQIAAGDFRC